MEPAGPGAKQTCGFKEDGGGFVGKRIRDCDVFVQFFAYKSHHPYKHIHTNRLLNYKTTRATQLEHAARLYTLSKLTSYMSGPRSGPPRCPASASALLAATLLLIARNVLPLPRVSLRHVGAVRRLSGATPLALLQPPAAWQPRGGGAERGEVGAEVSEGRAAPAGGNAARENGRPLCIVHSSITS